MKRRRAFSLIELLVVVAVIGILAALLIPAVQHAREAARRTTCKNHLKQLGVALHAYHDTNLVFPGGTNGSGCRDGVLCPSEETARHRWSAHIPLLPYLEQATLFDQIQANPSAPWTVFQNGELSVGSHFQTQLETLLCPSSEHRRQPGTCSACNSAVTNYVYCSGDDADRICSDDEFSAFNVDCRRPRGLFGRQSSVRMGDIKDGTSTTIAMSEAAHPEGSSGRGRGYVSNQGGDTINGDLPSDCLATYDPTTGQFLPGIPLDPNGWQGSRWQDGGNYYTRFVTVLPPNGPSCTVDAWQGGYITATSRHPGGVHSLMADGSVRLVSEFIDTGDQNVGPPLGTSQPSPYGVWGALGSKEGSELIQDF